MILDEVVQAMAGFFKDNPLNVVPALNNLQLYDPPLVAVAAADDPLFERLKEADAVGPHHMSPQEWLDGSKAVVSFFLPFTPAVRKANRTLGLPAVEWLYGRIEGQVFNDAMHKFLVDYFTAAGVRVVAPSIDPRFKVVSRRSNWSERHVAFVAGLGTFSLSRSLITKAGSAGRVGSVIVDADLSPTSRYYSELEENCSKCGACIPRCPPQAITEAGKDNAICSEYLDRVRIRCAPRYGCGKCQAGVPCEERIPTKRA
ncbi:MAG: epoxyqueuosine reductase [Negativicutes bacterium]|nr:epoxyqueuosine reductase [Negativicutes bacterium]